MGVAAGDDIDLTDTFPADHMGQPGGDVAAAGDGHHFHVGGAADSEREAAGRDLLLPGAADFIDEAHAQDE